MHKLLKDIAIVTVALILTGGIARAMQPTEKVTPVSIHTAKPAATVAPTPSVSPSEAPAPVKWQDNPNHCTDAQWIAENPPFPCIDKPVVAKTATVAPAASAVGGSGSCAGELAKYPWNQTVAYNVLMQESGGNPGRVNDNPSTGDYSVGCFQINLFGANAYSRPSEAWLKDAANNVSYAYGMWKSQGWGPWGACRKVACY